MEKVIFGNTGIKVSRLAFGTLTIGPWQAEMPVKEGAMILREAFDSGINLFDTAQAYDTYPYLKAAFNKQTGYPHLISRSYAYSYDLMKNAVTEALDETGFPEFLCFMLHEQESSLTLKGHRGALEFLIEAKKHGITRSVGISTHKPDGVRAALEEDAVDVIFAMLNKEGIGLGEGKLEEMLGLLESAASCGKVIMLMKALAGGHLFREVVPALEWARDLPFSPIIAVGMQNIAEIKVNTAIFSGENIDRAMMEKTMEHERRLHTEDCQGCGECVEHCPFGALSLRDGRVHCDHSRCMLCSYCARACPHFCLYVT